MGSLHPAIKELRFPTTSVRFIMQNYESIPADWDDVIPTAFVRFWNYQWFHDHMHNGTIERLGVKYQVLYHKCFPGELKHQRQVKLCFREALREYEIIPYVLVMKGD